MAEDADISWTEQVKNKEVLVRANKTSNILKIIWHRKHRWLEHVLKHDNLLHDKCVTRGRKKTELSHVTMEGRDYGQLKDFISSRSRRWKHDSK